MICSKLFNWNYPLFVFVFISNLIWLIFRNFHFQTMLYCLMSLFVFAKFDSIILICKMKTKKYISDDWRLFRSKDIEFLSQFIQSCFLADNVSKLLNLIWLRFHFLFRVKATWFFLFCLSTWSLSLSFQSCQEITSLLRPG